MDKSDSFLQTALDLLSYYQSGNDTSMRAVFDKARTHAGWLPKNEKFWYANVRLAFEMAGIVEIVESPSTQRWSFCTETEADLLPFGTKFQLIENGMSEDTTPVISTDEGLQLYRLISTGELVHQNPVFSSLLSRLPSSAEIESSVCNRVRGLPDTSRGNWQFFDFKQMRWLDVMNGQEIRPGLFRAWDRATGRSVWVVDQQNNSISFVSPEWAPMLAAKRNGLTARKIFAFENNSVSVPRAFKLPRAIMKELTLCSMYIHIDWNITFSDISEARYELFLAALSEKGLIA